MQGGKTVERLVDGRAQFLAPLLSEIFVCRAVPDRFAVEHHLSGVLGVRLQQQRVHIRGAGQFGGFRLHRLGASYLQSVGSGIGVERHVLCLEGSRSVALLQEYAAEGCGKNALAHIAARAYKHHGV